MSVILFLSKAWRRFFEMRGRTVLLLLSTVTWGGGLGSASAYTFTGHTGAKVEADVVSVSLAKQTVRLRLPTGKVAEIPFANVSEADQTYLRLWTPPERATPVASVTPAPVTATATAAATPSSTLFSKSSLLPDKVSTEPLGTPGATVTVEFPELAKDRQGDVAAMKIRLPDQYDPKKPMPLLLWFAPGEGGNDPKGGQSLVDSATWAIAAMPYPSSAKTPLHAMDEGKMDIIRDYHMTMLKKLKTLLPNVDPKLRFVAGFSNGAHCVGNYLADGEREFIDYFNGFVIIEGGCRRTDAKKTLRHAFAYVAWGTAEGNTEAFMGGIKSALKDGHLKVTSHGMKNVGHGFPDEEQGEVKTWIEKVAVPGILAAKPEQKCKAD